MTPIRHVILDLDGTVYRGDALLPATLPFLATLGELGIGSTFVTNNTSRGTGDYVTKLARMGIDVDASRIVTPVPAVVRHLRAQGRRTLFVLGTAALQAEFAAAGFALLEPHAGVVPNTGIVPDAGVVPDAVVVGFDTSLTYARLCRAAWFIAAGATWVATHPDRICPTNENTVLVDCGSLCAAIAAALGRGPDITLGKPDPATLTLIADRAGVTVTEIAVVGDRLYTDIAMANRAGAQSVLVLTGDTVRSDLDDIALRVEQKPRMVFDSLAEFGLRLRR